MSQSPPRIWRNPDSGATFTYAPVADTDAVEYVPASEADQVRTAAEAVVRIVDKRRLSNEGVHDFVLDVVEALRTALGTPKEDK